MSCYCEGDGGVEELRGRGSEESYEGAEDLDDWWFPSYHSLIALHER